jgi:hypothetical protein
MSIADNFQCQSVSLSDSFFCLDSNSKNELGPAGWASVMTALERCTSLSSLNGCSQYLAIMLGGLTELDIHGYEIAPAVGPLLPRSAATLTALDLR